MRLIIDIRLCEIEDPIVWRRVAIPIELTFESLHLIIQAAMGWQNQHLYSFKETKTSRYFDVVGPYTEEWGIRAHRTSASPLLWSYMNQFQREGDPRDKLFYLYDYGDNWLHEVDVVDLDRSTRTSAELLEGGGACPPENCGGIHGYERTKAYLSGNMTEEEYYDWVTAADVENFDANDFDLEIMRISVKAWSLLRER